jgi:hypothetical protein
VIVINYQNHTWGTCSFRGKQIQSGFVDFQPYPSARLHLRADQKEEMDLTFGGHRFLFGAEGSHRFLAPDFSGPSAKDCESPKPSAPLINSTGEGSPPPNYIKSVESRGLVEIFDKIAFGSNHSSIDNINLTQSKEVFADPSDGVTCPSQSVWLPSLTPNKNNEIASDPELEDCADSARHQICVIIAQNGENNEQAKESEAFDSQGNPTSIPQI